MKNRMTIAMALVACSLFGVLNGFCAESPKLAVKKAESYDLAADAKRKAAMSPQEAAWELLLEKNLGIYLVGYKNNKSAGIESAWDFVKDNPALPRVLLIGDSISRGYTLPARRALAGKANVHRPPVNCGSSEMGVKKLDVWLRGETWDIIHFNFGIWDRSTKDDVYASNLEKIVERLEKTGAKLIWARTTPPASGINNEKYTPAQCERINRIADAIMKKHGIPINDLYTTVAPKLAELQQTNNVHFSEAGYAVLGNQVAAEILVRVK
jgi:GDSL-like Lipase/Acylhydrolase family